MLRVRRARPAAQGARGRGATCTASDRHSGAGRTRWTVRCCSRPAWIPADTAGVGDVGRRSAHAHRCAAARGLVGVVTGMYGLLDATRTAARLGVPMLFAGLLVAVAGMLSGRPSGPPHRYRPDRGRLGRAGSSPASGITAAVVMIMLAGAVDPANRSTLRSDRCAGQNWRCCRAARRSLPSAFCRRGWRLRRHPTRTARPPSAPTAEDGRRGRARGRAAHTRPGAGRA